MFYQTILILFSIIPMFANSPMDTERNPKGKIQNYPPYTCYECLGSECDNPYNKTCDGALNCFTHTSVIHNMYILRQKGCFSVPFVALTLCQEGKLKLARNETINVTKCCDWDFCNDDEFIMPILHPSTSSSEIGKDQMHIEAKYLPYLIFLACVILSFAYAIAAVCLYATILVVLDFKKQFSNKNKVCPLPRFHKTPAVGDINDGFLSSGSGSGLPSLSQRSIVQDITLIQCIGQGRYGEVWEGKMHGENVAVKIFYSKDEASWQNEVNIYTNIPLCHENVLGFKGAAIVSRFGVTQMWLLTTFYKQGSLYDYLLENTVTLKQMILFIRSACCGILHLHTEVLASKGKQLKPAIAHRDLKSRNILLTSHGMCVIADFGLAVIKGNETSNTNIPMSYQVGTKRYMAPEILDESMNLNSFESLKRADMYAFGLVMWEICSRCVIDGTAEVYRPPFDDCVTTNPDFEDMKKVVCIESKRPEIPDRWLSNELLCDMANLMKMCWHKNPEVRCSAFRVMKTLDKMLAQI